MQNKNAFFNWFNNYYKIIINNELAYRFINLLTIDVIIKAAGLVLMYVYLNIMKEPGEYGIYGLVLNLIGSVSLFMNFGLYVAQTSFYNDYKDRLGVLIFNLNLVLTFLLIIIYIIFYTTLFDFKILNYLIGENIGNFSLPRYRIWIWIGISVQIYATMTNSYFIMSKRKIRLFQYYNASKLIITNAITLYILNNNNFDQAYNRIKYSMILDSIITLPFFIYYIRLVHFKIDFLLIKKALYIGIPIMIAALIGSVYGLIDRKILLKYCNNDVLGVYTYAYTFTSNLWIFLQAFLNAFWPTFMDEKTPKISFTKTLRITKKILILFTIIAICMFLFAFCIDLFKIINLKYRTALEIMPLMFVTQLILVFSTIMSNYYIYFKKTYLQIFVSLISLYTNWQFCILFIPVWGIWGAVFATLIATLLTCIINYIFAFINCNKHKTRPEI